MAMPELQKFRQKYPQYNDLDDNALANMLAKKYPNAYGDLPRRIQGEIRKPRGFGQELIAQARRKGAIGAQALAGDIPFLRQALPQQIRQVKPFSPVEKGLQFGTRLGRDVGLMKGIGKLGLARTALRGAGIGMGTAGTERPEQILGAGARGAATLPILKAGVEKLTPMFQKLAGKGIKTAQQGWQDIIRAGFTVEKSTVQRIQQKGIQNIFSKRVNPQIGTRNRSEDAFWKLGNKIFDSTMRLRRSAGNAVGRWRDMLFKDPRIKTSIVNTRNTFQAELKKPDIGLLDTTGKSIRPVQIGADTTVNRLLQINEQLSSGDIVTPQVAYNIIDRLDDLVSASKKGVLSLAKNEGRIVMNLRRDLINQITKSAPRHIAKGLRATETRFAEIADISDDVFNKLPVRAEGVARKELVGATEKSLQRGLKADTSFQERQIWERLERILPQQDKFMELYKDIFAAQDLSREGMGFIFRRILLAPRMAAFGMQATQPLMRGTGQVLGAAGQAAKGLLPPHLMRRAIQGRR